MSDGPHRSLPLKPAWKRLSERAAKAAFSPDEVCEMLPAALLGELSNSLIDALRDIANGERQHLLFEDHREMMAAKMEALRSDWCGSAPANRFIDAGQEALRQGLSGDQACEAALESTFRETARTGVRSIEEHYFREAGPKDARYVRTRLDNAIRLFDMRAIVKEKMLPKQHRGVTRMPPRKTDLDQGPPL
jgi:hypothetical protein